MTISPDDAERIFKGTDPDSPVTRALGSLRALAAGPVPDAGPVVAQMAAAAAKGSGLLAYLWLVRPRGFMVAMVLGGAAFTGGAVSGGLAATGQFSSDEAPAPVVSETTSTTTARTTSTAAVSSIPAPTTSMSAPTTSMPASTTTVPVAPSTEGPGRCQVLDATIVAATATIEPNNGNLDDTLLSMVVHTTGTVDQVGALYGSGSSATEHNSFDLLESDTGTWTGTVSLPNGRNRGGEMMMFSAIGCGFDEIEVNMIGVGAP